MVVAGGVAVGCCSWWFWGGDVRGRMNDVSVFSVTVLSAMAYAVFATVRCVVCSIP